MENREINSIQQADLQNSEEIKIVSFLASYQSQKNSLSLMLSSFQSNEDLCNRQRQERQGQHQVISATQSIQLQLTSEAKPSKSVFHNFQKHLISIIKKFVSFSRSRLLYQEQGELAYAIWTTFLTNRAINKKVLNLVFGVVEINTSVLQLQSLSEKNESFRKLICLAQKLLREKTAEQARSLSKQFLKDHCSISKFEEFHIYFRNFIAEIEAGPLPRRMTKETKSMIMPKNRNIQRNHD